MLIAGSIGRIHLLRNLFMERQLVVILPRRQPSPVIRERQERPAGKASIHASFFLMKLIVLGTPATLKARLRTS